LHHRGFSGPVTFQYTISDGYSLRNASANVTLQVDSSSSPSDAGMEVNIRLVLSTADNLTVTAAACPGDVTKLTALADQFAVKLRGTEGVTSVTMMAVKCEFIVSGSRPAGGGARRGGISVSTQQQGPWRRA
jgi:hypothetical protein